MGYIRELTSTEISEEASNLLQSSTGMFMRELSSRITSRSVDCLNLEQIPDNPMNGEIMLLHYSLIWEVWLWLLYKTSTIKTFLMCLNAKEAIFILDPLSKLLRPKNSSEALNFVNRKVDNYINFLT